MADPHTALAETGGPASRGFAPGASVAWRNCIRSPASLTEQPAFAVAMLVVHDRPDELALFRSPGHPMKRRNAEAMAAPASFRHPFISRWLPGWRDEPDWSRWRVLVLTRPSAGHAVSLFWDAATDSFAFWYIDLIGPVRRRPFGFDFPDHGLDIVVEPDLSSWKWKDEDELEWSVDLGIYTRAEADALYAEGRHAVDRLTTVEHAEFERWRAWRPEPSWGTAALPPGWDET